MRKLLVCLAFAITIVAFTVPGATAQGPDDAQVVRIYFQDKDQLNELASFLDVWEVHHDLGYFVARIGPYQRDLLAERGVEYEVDEELTRQLHTAVLQTEETTSGIPGYPCYRTVEETYADLDALAANHPDLATWSDVGDSWEKVTPGGNAGYDIQALVITNHAISGPKPKFFMIAAIHAREYTTAELATRFAEKLINDYGVDPDITWLVDNYEFHLIPQANPDGRKMAEAGKYWRKNTDNDDGCDNSNSWGTDLNRNSSFKWSQVGASSDACSEIYYGPSAASEPEVQAIENYARSIFPDQRGPNDDDPAPADAQGVFITLHSYSQLVLFPWEWTDSVDAPNKTGLQTLGRKFGYYNQYKVCSDCLYNASGVTDDFTYGELGVASYTFELGDAFFQACSDFENDIIPKNMPALIYAFKAARRPYLDPAGPEIVNVTLDTPPPNASSPVTLTATADDSRYDSGGQGDEPVQNIQAARYTIDVPSWQGAVTHAMTAADGAFDSSSEAVTATIDVTGLSNDRHIIFVEGQDADGNWGVPTAIFLDNCTPPQAPAGISASITSQTDLHLAWNHISADYYELWRSSSPYFLPDDAGAELISTLQAADGVFAYTDVGAVGSPTEQHYYLLRTANACGDFASSTPRSGEFDFALVPGQ